MRSLAMAAVVVASVVGLGACGSSSHGSSVHASKQATKQQRSQNAVPVQLVAANQATDGFRVTVATVAASHAVTSTAKAYVVLASELGGKPGTVLGYTSVGVGVHHGVGIQVAAKLTPGQYFVVLVDGAKPPTSLGDATVLRSARITLS